MSELVETVARAIYDYQMSGMDCRWENEGNKDTWTEWARAALAAIEASGVSLIETAKLQEIATAATEVCLELATLADAAGMHERAAELRRSVSAQAERFIEANTVKGGEK